MRTSRFDSWVMADFLGRLKGHVLRLRVFKNPLSFEFVVNLASAGDARCDLTRIRMACPKSLTP